MCCCNVSSSVWYGDVMKPSLQHKSKALALNNYMWSTASRKTITNQGSHMHHGGVSGTLTFENWDANTFSTCALSMSPGMFCFASKDSSSSNNKKREATATAWFHNPPSHKPGCRCSDSHRRWRHFRNHPTILDNKSFRAFRQLPEITFQRLQRFLLGVHWLWWRS